jgi:hypothetical protein
LKRAPLVIATLCTGAVLLWQFLTIRYNCGGDWSALYYTGAYVQVPPAIADEQIYRFAGASGYDGQFYHFIAHDPFLRHDTAPYVDNPRLRWRRILVPALAWLAALGQSDFVDSAYDAVVLVFVFLGTYWTGRYLVRCNLPPAWSAAFVLVPAVLVSIDRATVDVALAALCAGFALYAVAEPSWKIYPILALAPLARETGLCLIAAFAAVELWNRHWRGALLAVAAALPFLAWLLFLNAHTAPDLTVFASAIPLKGLIARTLHPIQYSTATAWLMKAAALDYLAVLGIWVALVAAVLSRDAAALAFAAVAVFLAQPQAWGDAYSFGRTLSPLLLCVALAGARRRAWWTLAPIVLVLPRVFFQLLPQLRGILRSV